MTKIGFKITDQFGRGVDGQGVLINEKGDTVTTFRAFKFGIGNFSFTPVAGSSYMAVIRAAGKEQLKAMPAAANGGYSMHLEKTGKGQIRVNVHSSQATGSQGLVYLFVHTRNIIKAVLANRMENGQAEFQLDENSMGEGISQFTLFNDKRQPVCERLFFKRPERRLMIEAVPDRAVYELRSKINIEVNSATEAGRQTGADLSMAVCKVDPGAVVNEEDISNYLLLRSDLMGAIEAPQYYFSADGDSTGEAIDNLMLTQGWRRFKWDDVSSNQEPVFRFLPEINGHIINARLRSLQPGLPVQGVKAYLTVPGTRTQFQTATSNEKGLLKFEMKNFYSEGDIVVQTNSNTSNAYRIDVEGPFVTTPASRPSALWLFQENSGHIRRLFSVPGPKCLFRRAVKPVVIEAMGYQFFLWQSRCYLPAG
jgi:hypothetical protein